KTHISAALAGHIRAAFNGRYHQFFSHSDIYFVAFCLDPRAYPIGDYLCERVVPAPEAPTHIKFSHAFLRVKAFIKTLLKGLIDRHQKHDSGCNCHPIFQKKDISKTSLEIVRECQAQLEACWQGEVPFHAPILNDAAMEWWENLEIGYSPRSGVLAMLAVRIFGILANSMPDERTNSNITWFNSPLRGNQKAENLLDMILVGQWHTYHAEVLRRPRRNPTVAFRRLNPEFLEKVKHKAADHSNSDSETDSDSDKESDQSPTLPLLSQNLFPRIPSSLLLPWERSHRTVRTRRLTESVAGIIVKSGRQRRKGKRKYFRLTQHSSLIQKSTCAQLDSRSFSVMSCLHRKPALQW
ncbi:hypothetical protein FB451DRAFT_1055250, partial [Mycena latifolia]